MRPGANQAMRDLAPGCKKAGSSQGQPCMPLSSVFPIGCFMPPVAESAMNSNCWPLILLIHCLGDLAAKLRFVNSTLKDGYLKVRPVNTETTYRHYIFIENHCSPDRNYKHSFNFSWGKPAPSRREIFQCQSGRIPIARVLSQE